MISAGIRIDHVRHDELAALYRFCTEAPSESRIGDPRHGLVVIIRSGLPVVVVDLRSGIAPPPSWMDRDRPIDAASLRRLRLERDATWAAACGAEIVRRLDAALAARFDPRADLLACLLPLAHEVRAARKAGEFLFSPAVLEDVPIPAEGAVRAAVDLVFPDGTTALLYAFGPRGLSFGVIAERRGGEIVRLAGHDALGGIAVRGAQWKAAVPRILKEAAQRMAPPSVGVFADEAALRRVVFGTEPAALPRALASRDVILDPLPPWLAVLLGVDTAAKAAGTARSVLRRLDPFGLAERIDLGRLGDRARRRLGAEFPLPRILGFDPLAVIDRLQRWREL